MLSKLLPQVADFLLQGLNLLFVPADIVGVDGNLLFVSVNLGDVHVDLLLKVG